MVESPGFKIVIEVIKAPRRRSGRRKEKQVEKGLICFSYYYYPTTSLIFMSTAKNGDEQREQVTQLEVTAARQKKKINIGMRKSVER